MSSTVAGPEASDRKTKANNLGLSTRDEDRGKAISPARMAWQRFRRHRMAMVGVAIMLFLFLYVTAGALIFPESFANQTATASRLQPPSAAHPFGTDAVGRDVLARTIYGGHISLAIGISAMLVSLILGVTVGALAGYYGGLLDGILMRLTEAMFSIPSLFLLIVMSKFFSGRIPNVELLGRTFSGSVVVIIVVIGFTSWMYLARIVRANYLSLKEREFILAARCLGIPNRRIIVNHILPNTLAPIIVAATLGVAGAILSEAYVSFLGLGVQPPTASWGNMLEGSYVYVESAPWLWFFPGILTVLTVLSINFIGDGLRDALDPRSLR
jgi:peptide/nickel transport system permease protein